MSVIYDYDAENFDLDIAEAYVEDGEEILYFGETDDMVHFAITETDRAFKAYLHKPGYTMGEIDWQYNEVYDNPLWIEEFDYVEDAIEFVDENVATDW